jgi:hypothetical protein
LSSCGEGPDRLLQIRIAAPDRHQRGDPGQRGDIALGRRHRNLRPGAERQHHIGQAVSGEVVIDQRHHQRARPSVARRWPACPGCGPIARWQGTGCPPVAPPAHHRARQWKSRRDRGHAKAGLDQIFGIGGGVIRRSARAGHHQRGRRGAQALAQLRQRLAACARKRPPPPRPHRLPACIKVEVVGLEGLARVTWTFLNFGPGKRRGEQLAVRAMDGIASPALEWYYQTCEICSMVLHMYFLI